LNNEKLTINHLNAISKMLGIPTLDQLVEEHIQNKKQEQEAKSAELFDEEEWNEIASGKC